MRPARILVGLIGGIVALVAIGMLVGGAALGWAYGTQRDADGFFTSPEYDLATSAYALTSTDIDLASAPGDWWPSDLADLRLDVTSGGDTSVFVGLGPTEDVADYLAGVSYDEIVEVGRTNADLDYRSYEGGAPATPPGDLAIWAVSTAGSGAQSLTWDVEAGSWTVVVMNADASPGVEVTAAAAAKIGIALAVAIALVIAGIVVGGLGAWMLVWSTGRISTAEAPREALPAGAGVYPVTVEGALQPGLSRWLWLVKWLLAIPHLVVLAFLWIAFMLLTIVALFAILFTGRYPRGIFDFNVGVMRWSWRVGFYAYSALGTDQYPPFTLADADYPARLDVAYPEELSRGLVLVKWWLLAIPHYLIVGLFTSGLVWWTTDIGQGDQILQVGGGLIGILVIIAAFAIAFTSRYPKGLFDLVIGLNRWVYRVVAYAALMRDEYPPFRLDLGGSEPSRPRQAEPRAAGGGTHRAPPIAPTSA